MRTGCLVLSHVIALIIVGCLGQETAPNPRGWEAAKGEGAVVRLPVPVAAAPPPPPPPPPAADHAFPLGAVAATIAASFLLGVLIGRMMVKAQPKSVSQTTTLQEPGNQRAPGVTEATSAAPQDSNQPGAHGSAANLEGADGVKAVEEVAGNATFDSLEVAATTVSSTTIITSQPHEGPLAVAAAATGSDASQPLPLTSAETNSDVADVHDAARLVSSLMAAMHIDPNALTTSERLQTVNTVLAAWQTKQAQRHGEAIQQLGLQANVISSQRVHIAADSVAHTKARDARALARERLATFHAACLDILLTGIVIMMAVAAYRITTLGLFRPFVTRCGTVPLFKARTSWGLWTAVQSARVVTCYFSGAVDGAIATLLLFAAPWLLYRTGLVTGYHSTPVFRLLTGLGLVCGGAGYVAVGRVGGAAWLWVVCWEVWVAIHIALSAAAYRLNSRASSLHVGGGGGHTGVYEEEGGWVLGLMWLVVGVGVPVATGLAPFMKF